LVVASLWWWGVVFDLWIVVASIDPAVFWLLGLIMQFLILPRIFNCFVL
jgi:hypothetical protein